MNFLKPLNKDGVDYSSWSSWTNDYQTSADGSSVSRGESFNEYLSRTRQTDPDGQVHTDTANTSSHNVWKSTHSAGGLDIMTSSYDSVLNEMKSDLYPTSGTTKLIEEFDASKYFNVGNGTLFFSSGEYSSDRTENITTDAFGQPYANELLHITTKTNYYELYNEGALLGSYRDTKQWVESDYHAPLEQRSSYSYSDIMTTNDGMGHTDTFTVGNNSYHFASDSPQIYFGEKG
ncbi:MAG: hypothetical protein JWO43_508 [Candidatus Adlerbacteria bacterium]|nr:hypothetical protein [Candidatus Adlerbacteria bacterium]